MLGITMGRGGDLVTGAAYCGVIASCLGRRDLAGMVHLGQHGQPGVRHLHHSHPRRQASKRPAGLRLGAARSDQGVEDRALARAGQPDKTYSQQNSPMTSPSRRRRRAASAAPPAPLRYWLS